MLTRVIFNQKGGVGKSSIAVNLAAMSAYQGLRTLLIDLDPQCNATQYIVGDAATDIHPAHITEPNIENFFSQTLQATSNPMPMMFAFPFGGMTGSRNQGLEHCIHITRFDNLSLIPASPMLADILQTLESKHKIYKLAAALKELARQYDNIFIDTPPAFNFYTLSALIASERCLIPFDCDEFSRRALYTLLENVGETRADHNADLEVEGIIVNQFQPRASLPLQLINELKEEGLPIMANYLPSSVIMKESHHKSLPLVFLAPQHKLTEQYVALFGELQEE